MPPSPYHLPAAESTHATTPRARGGAATLPNWKSPRTGSINEDCERKAATTTRLGAPGGRARLTALPPRATATARIIDESRNKTPRDPRGSPETP